MTPVTNNILRRRKIKKEFFYEKFFPGIIVAFGVLAKNHFFTVRVITTR